MGLHSRMLHNSDLGFKVKCVISAALASPNGIAEIMTLCKQVSPSVIGYLNR